MKSYTTNKKHCKEIKSLITVSKDKSGFKAVCNDCNLSVLGKREVTDFLIK